MKTFDELLNMDDQDRSKYLLRETQRIISEAPEGPVRNRLAGLQWELDQLRNTKYKNDPQGLLLEINTRMFKALQESQKKFLEIKDIAKQLKLDKE